MNDNYSSVSKISEVIIIILLNHYCLHYSLSHCVMFTEQPNPQVTEVRTQSYKKYCLFHRQQLTRSQNF